jgi:hypothetical protein
MEWIKLNPLDEQKLEVLNIEVDTAIKKRTRWLDKKMSEYSPLQIGDDIYNLKTGEKLGTVTKLYRYYQNQFEDNELSIHYVYSTPYGNNNTSSQMLTEFDIGSKEEVKKRLATLQDELDT